MSKYVKNFQPSDFFGLDEFTKNDKKQDVILSAKRDLRQAKDYLKRDIKYYGKDDDSPERKKLENRVRARTELLKELNGKDGDVLVKKIIDFSTSQSASRGIGGSSSRGMGGTSIGY